MATNEVQKVRFHYLYGRFYFPSRTDLKAYILLQLQKATKSVDTITYIFCDDEYLLALNKQHLRHNTYTDIVTFELSQKNEPLMAEIYISVDRVRENAFTYNVPFQQELYRVIFHGALHLAGFNDKTKGEKKIMRTKEDEWINNFTVSREITK